MSISLRTETSTQQSRTCRKFIRRVNYQRKKRGLPNARYVYVTAYNPTEEIRWHHHIVMDGDMDMDVVEGVLETEQAGTRFGGCKRTRTV